MKFSFVIKNDKKCSYFIIGPKRNSKTIIQKLQGKSLKTMDPKTGKKVKTSRS